MKIVVIGGTGLIGSTVVTNLATQGHEAVAASPDTGVNTLTGEGLGEALAGADVVVDVSNSPSFEDAAVLEFFETSTRNLLEAEAAAGIGHHIALSVVGSERLADSGYMRAKVAQEKLITSSSIPFSIVHATQFFEFARRIADAATDGDTVRVPTALIQPMAAEDVAAEVCRVALAPPLNGTVEVGGPEPLRFEDFVRERLRADGDERAVVADPAAQYFGAQLSERSLVPGEGARLAPTRFGDWLGRQANAELIMAGDVMKDRDLQRRISELVDEEHALERGLALPLEEHRLDGIAAELDQCWDLLRQRHARLAAGLDADGAHVRSASVVGSYLQ